jgi:phosphohistidine phosphatase
MHLYLLRHAEAVPRQFADPQRELTPHGQWEIEAVARQFTQKGILLDACYCSPYLRATQTAAHFLERVGSTLVPDITERLTPERRARAVLAWLEPVAAEHVLIVSHNPLVSELLAVLTGRSEAEMHIMSTCEMNALHVDLVDVGQARLLFRLAPVR